MRGTKWKKERKWVKKPVWIMGYHWEKLSTYCWSPRGEEREKRVESLFKEITAVNFSKSGEGFGHTCSCSSLSPWNFNPKWSSPRHITIRLSKKQRENFKSSRRRKPPYIQRNPHKPICGFLSRNFGGQEREEWYIQSDERKNCQPRILFRAK